MASLFKVHYRPLEAAIRWSGLARYERQILSELNGQSPYQIEFPRWPWVSLNTQRIYDAIINRELPCAINGIVVRDPPDFGNPDNPALTVRHVDLKVWMRQYYPDQRPQFLFSRLERAAHPTITIDAVCTLFIECENLKIQLRQRDREIDHLRDELKANNRVTRDAAAPTDALSLRGETAYLHTVGSLMSLLLGHAPSGQPYSSFRTQESIITVMVAEHGDRLGISERTLQEKFAAAKRALLK